MLPAEEPLDLLVDRLRGLSPGDRRSVLARLSLPERRQVEAALLNPSAHIEPHFASDIIARIVAPPTESLMTAATRDVLLRIAGYTAPMASPAAGPSLLGRLASTFWRH